MNGSKTQCKKTLIVIGEETEEAIEQCQLLCYAWCNKALECDTKGAHRDINPRLLPVLSLEELVAARPSRRALREWRRAEVARAGGAGAGA